MWMLLSMSLFAFSLSVTPGPVNLVSFINGLNHGLYKAQAFVLGATIGFCLLLMACGLGMEALIGQHPQLGPWLGALGAVFILYLGYRIAFGSSSEAHQQQPLAGFLQGFTLQWLNPKAWAACLSAVSAFNLTQSGHVLLLFVGLYFVCCYLGISLWAWVGTRLRHHASSARVSGYLNLATGVTLFLLGGYLFIQRGLSLPFD
ncbi:LysE family translocator [Bowmanella dokdonensis]|uniref:LysE family translocator n=1 Tax=Bowmanella dokdonensis TaxID=751969 RepID=A0A939DLY2_9ALTE|nr:LysE family translocator [Bowmanella dokdonensis]MBN7825067.1 LysE family translocator [Bowmanella dokdonensis]